MESLVPPEVAVPEAIIFTVDAKRMPYIVLRITRLGTRHDRLVLTIGEDGTVHQTVQHEGTPIIG